MEQLCPISLEHIPKEYAVTLDKAVYDARSLAKNMAYSLRVPHSRRSMTYREIANVWGLVHSSSHIDPETVRLMHEYAKTLREAVRAIRRQDLRDLASDAPPRFRKRRRSDLERLKRHFVQFSAMTLRVGVVLPDLAKIAEDVKLLRRAETLVW